MVENETKSRISADVPLQLKQKVMSRLALETPRRTLTDLIIGAMRDYIKQKEKEAIKKGRANR